MKSVVLGLLKEANGRQALPARSEEFSRAPNTESFQQNTGASKLQNQCLQDGLLVGTSWGWGF